MGRILKVSMSAIVLWSILGMISCGARQKAPLPGGNVRPPGDGTPLVGGDEFDYQWDDQSCVDGALLGTKLNSATITSLAESKRKDVSTFLENIVDASGKLDEQMTQTKVMQRTRFARDCVKSGQRCQDFDGSEPSFKETDAGKTPKFCRASGNYSVDSIERVTLTATLSFKHAMEFAAATYNEDGRIPDVELMILPRFESNQDIETTQGGTQKVTSVIVNNLAYFPASGQATPFIAVFPRRLGDGESTARLWEAPFVLAHELGHHVERHLGIDHYGESERSMVRLAISEAFADLNGFASDTLSDTIVRNIPGVGLDRAVNSSMFRDGGDKIIDQTEMVAIESHNPNNTALVALTSEFSPNQSLSEIKYGGHGVGAILAYNVNRMISEALDAVNINPRERVTAFAKASLDWLKETDKLVGKGSKSARKDLISASHALEMVTKNIFSQHQIELKENIADALCQRMAIGFGGTGEKTWFGRDCSKSTHLTD